MNLVLRYGVDSQVELGLADEAVVAECGMPRGSPIRDVSTATAASLRSPLEYPSLADATTPADRIVVVLESGVPQVEPIVAAVIGCLVEAGVDPDGLTLLRTPTDVESGRGDPRRDLPEALKRSIPVITHEPDNRRKMAYLAATRHGDPVFLNRAITDADVVVPIGRIRSAASPGYHGMNGVVFPAFSDHPTQQRFRTPPGEGEKSHQARLVVECDEVGWLLGVTFAVGIVPGPGEEILEVLAGEIGAVRAHGRELYEQAWWHTVPRKASLVVAAIQGGASQQTWQNVGTALDLAGELVEEGGAIAVCCDLSAQPGPAVQHLIGARSRQIAMRQIRKDRAEDVLQATQLARALDRADVYLLSRLDHAMVEDLEMAPISNTAELVRLAHRHQSCILVSNAPNAIVTVEKKAGRMREEG